MWKFNLEYLVTNPHFKLESIVVNAKCYKKKIMRQNQFYSRAIKDKIKFNISKSEIKHTLNRRKK